MRKVFGRSKLSDLALRCLLCVCGAASTSCVDSSSERARLDKTTQTLLAPLTPTPQTATPVVKLRLGFCKEPELGGALPAIIGAGGLDTVEGSPFDRAGLDIQLVPVELEHCVDKIEMMLSSGTIDFAFVSADQAARINGNAPSPLELYAKPSRAAGNLALMVAHIAPLSPTNKYILSTRAGEMFAKWWALLTGGHVRVATAFVDGETCVLADSNTPSGKRVEFENSEQLTDFYVKCRLVSDEIFGIVVWGRGIETAAQRKLVEFAGTKSINRLMSGTIVGKTGLFTTQQHKAFLTAWFEAAARLETLDDSVVSTVRKLYPNIDRDQLRETLRLVILEDGAANADFAAKNSTHPLNLRQTCELSQHMLKLEKSACKFVVSQEVFSHFAAATQDAGTTSDQDTLSVPLKNDAEKKAFDACMQQPRGAAAPAFAGPNARKAIAFSELHFQRGKAYLVREDVEAAMAIGLAMLALPAESHHITILSHTDSEGSRADNCWLSVGRASFIRDWLIATFSIHPAQISYRSIGEADALPYPAASDRNIGFEIEFLIQKTRE